MPLNTWEQAAADVLNEGPRGQRLLANFETRLEEIEFFLDAARKDEAERKGALYAIIDDALIEWLAIPDADGLRWTREQIEASVLQTIAMKQHDYGHDNILWAGFDGVIIRMHDKVARIKNLQKRDERASLESVRDSWLDIAGYGIICLMLLNGTFELQLEADMPMYLDVPTDAETIMNVRRETMMIWTEGGVSTWERVA